MKSYFQLLESVEQLSATYGTNINDPNILAHYNTELAKLVSMIPDPEQSLMQAKTYLMTIGIDFDIPEIEFTDISEIYYVKLNHKKNFDPYTGTYCDGLEEPLYAKISAFRGNVGIQIVTGDDFDPEDYDFEEEEVDSDLNESTHHLNVAGEIRIEPQYDNYASLISPKYTDQIAKDIDGEYLGHKSTANSISGGHKFKVKNVQKAYDVIDTKYPHLSRDTYHSNLKESASLRTQKHTEHHVLANVAKQESINFKKNDHYRGDPMSDYGKDASDLNDLKKISKLIIPAKVYSGNGEEVESILYTMHKNRKPGQKITIGSAAPGGGYVQHRITKVDHTGIHGYTIKDTRRTT